MKINWSDLNPFKPKYNVVFCLNGGGARTMAYIGAYDFLYSKGVRPKGFVAQSAGSLVALSLALGIDSVKSREFFRTFSMKQHLHGVHLPLMDPVSLRSYFNKFLPDQELSSFNPKIYLAAIETESASLEYLHSDVSCLDAVMATSALPGIIGPYPIGDKRYIDGGFINGTDVAFAKRIFPKQKIIEFDVGVRNGFFYFREVTIKTIDIFEGGIHSHDSRDEQPDYRLHFDGIKGGTFSPEHIDDNYETGYKTAQEAWPKIKEILKRT